MKCWVMEYEMNVMILVMMQKKECMMKAMEVFFILLLYRLFHGFGLKA
jgi:hypothetical protein